MNVYRLGLTTIQSVIKSIYDRHPQIHILKSHNIRDGNLLLSNLA